MLIHRRTLLAGSAALASAATMRRARAGAGPRTLRMGYLFSTNSHLGSGATLLANEVAKRTGGRLQIQQFPDASLGGEVEMLKAMQLGTVDMAFITGAALAVAVPEVGVFNIPFLFKSNDQAHAVFDGPIGQSYLTRFAAKGLVPLAWGENGLRHLTNARHPVATPDDLKGLKLRVPQSPTMLVGFKALGADVNSLPFPKLYSALQAGVFDAQENPIATIISAKFFQVQKYLSLTGHVYDPALLLMSPDTHDDLSPEDQAIILAAGKLAAVETRRYSAQAAAEGVATLRAAGMQVLENVDRAPFAAAVNSAIPEFEKTFGKQTIDDIRNAA